MALDPNIPLSVKPPAMPNPLEIVSAIAQLQGVREQTEARRLAGEERRAKAQEEAAKRQREQELDTLLSSAVTRDPTTGEFTVDYDKLVGHLPTDKLFAVKKQFDEDKTRLIDLRTKTTTLEKDHRALRGSVARSIEASNYDPTVWGLEMRVLRNAGALTPEQFAQVDAITDPEQMQRLVAAAKAAAAGDEKLEQITTVDAQGREVTQFVQPAAGATYPTAPPKPEKIETVDAAGKPVTQFVLPTVGATYPAKPVEEKHSTTYLEWQDYQSTGGTLSFDAYATMDANRRRAVTHVNTGQASDADVQEMLSGMIEGTLPPQLPGRASPLYTKILAAAHRRGYDLAGAATDWAATQKHIQTMNGAQQLRLNQAVNALPEMLNNVESLAKQWNAGRFPALNRAHLALAKGGAYGTAAAQIANKLDAQIADVVADLGNVYMGGNSPTDHALSLAGKSLSADWSEPVLRAMVALAKQNVQIRRNSINSTGVAGASADNPYMPAPPPPPPDARIGTTVTYNGKPYKVVGVTPAGKLQLAPLP